jgi:hypothetical protein
MLGTASLWSRLGNSSKDKKVIHPLTTTLLSHGIILPQGRAAHLQGPNAVFREPLPIPVLCGMISDL